jgi:hypothetical protein
MAIGLIQCKSAIFRFTLDNPDNYRERCNCSIMKRTMNGVLRFALDKLARDVDSSSKQTIYDNSNYF